MTVLLRTGAVALITLMVTVTTTAIVLFQRVHTAYFVSDLCKNVFHGIAYSGGYR